MLRLVSDAPGQSRDILGAAAGNKPRVHLQQPRLQPVHRRRVPPGSVHVFVLLERIWEARKKEATQRDTSTHINISTTSTHQHINTSTHKHIKREARTR